MTVPNINVFYARLLIDYLVQRGVGKICLSPGSRSTPLVIAAAENPELDVKVIIDERASGYYATGYARACGVPIAIISTSGTAAANFLPSVVEAYQSRLPVIFITADRPLELQGCGANQTINQINLFGSYARSITLEAPDKNSNPSKILDQLERSLDGLPEPVHINCRFRDPLAPLKEEFDINSLIRRVDDWYRKRQMSNQKGNISSEPDLTEVAEITANCEKGLIIMGPEAPFRAPSDLVALSDMLGWPILGDILSQYRFSNSQDICILYDLYLGSEAIAEKLKPEVVFHFGGYPISQRLNLYLKNCGANEYIKIQSHERTNDPNHMETRRIVNNPDMFIKKILSLLKKKAGNDYLESWIRTDSNCRQIITKRLNELSEPAVAWQISQLLEDDEALFLSNSMPVRDADSFMFSSKKNIAVGCNRGASGIDGVIASACGFAAGNRRPVTLIIGDLAVLHDMNSLKIVSESEYPVRVIIINNNGGGIFHFLPIAGFENVFEEFFAAPVNLNFEKPAEMFDLDYFVPSSVTEFRKAFEELQKSNKSGIIEVKIDRNENFAEHCRILSLLHQDLNGVLDS